MTVHTVRQHKALQRAHQRWQLRPAPAPRRPSVIERINHIVDRLHESPSFWAWLGVVAMFVFLLHAPPLA